MDKMISVINENLKSVIAGIKSHREEAEETLAKIESEISEKVQIAGSYKESVNNSKTTISNLENEISDLEHDLEELVNKFGDNFKELITAGNKEINGKIIEKRALVKEQTDNILELTKKVQLLKEELIKLTDKKEATAATLKSSLILENYYVSRLNSIIDYSVNHTAELENFIEVDSNEELDSVEIDKAELVSPVDDTIFKEIDSISTNDIDDDMLESVLTDDTDEPEEVEEVKEIEITNQTVNEQLDDIISSAASIIEKTAALNSKEIPKIEETSIPSIEVIPEEKKVEEVSEEPKEVEEANDDMDFEIHDVTFDDDIDKQLEEIINEYDDGIKQYDEEISDIELEPIEEEEEEVKEENTVVEESTPAPELEEETEEDAVEINLEEEENDLSSLNNFTFDENIKIETDDFKDLGIDLDRFSESDRESFKTNFNKDNAKNMLDVINKHGINKDVIYSSANIFDNLTPQNLDIILSNLEKTGADANSIEYIFNKLDKVNVNELESSVRKDKNREIVEVLFDAIDYEGEIDLKELFDLSNDEYKKLKSSAIGNDFKIINAFPKIIEENYNTLKRLGVENIKECFVKYPHRFILNPTNFNDILDKYDTEDLVRCINKNSAVINRL